MSELVVKVSKDARVENQTILLAAIAIISALFITIHVEIGEYYRLLFPILWISLFALFANIISKYVKFSEAPEAIITIATDGIHIIWNGGKARKIKWSELVCVDIYQAGPEQTLRIAPKNFAFKKIQYSTKHLSVCGKEILAFVHEVCPYGKDISIWNERRQ